MQIARGAVGICCAKLGEAEVFADAGINDIRLPYPLNRSTPTACLRSPIASRSRSLPTTGGRAGNGRRRAVAAHRKLDVLIKVDVGLHRCGIDPDEPAAPERSGNRLAAGAALQGSAQPRRTWRTARRRTPRWRRSRAARRRSCAISPRGPGPLRGVQRRRHADRALLCPQKGLTEIRPGNYAYFDRTQVGLGSAAGATARSPSSRASSAGRRTIASFSTAAARR